MTWLLFYTLFLCILAFYSRSKNAKNSSDTFFINNRQSSTMAVGFSIVASCVGGSATIGMAGLAWQVGTPAFWWLGSGAFGLCILAFFLARIVRESRAYTLPEMVTTFLGAPARPMVSLIIILAWLAITAAQFSAMKVLILPLMPNALAALPAPLNTFFHDFDISTLALFLGAFIVIIYACIGGQAAIIKSDMVQYTLLILALLVAFLLLFSATDDTHNPLWTTPMEIVNEQFPLSKLSYFFLILGGSYVVCPMLFGRIYSAKNSKIAHRGSILAVILLVLTAMLIVGIGLLCRAFITLETPGIAPEKVLTTVFFEYLPPWAQVITFLGLFSALISSADSSLLTAATICSNDILRTKNIFVCRLCTVAIGLISIILALSGKGILQLLLMANDIYVCGVVIPVFIGTLLFKHYTFHPQGITATIGIGGAFGLVAALSGENMYSYIGIAVALLLSFACAKKRVSHI